MPSGEPKIISYAAARSAGLKRYFTGKPCSRGHISERNASSRDCVICLSLRHAAWRGKNVDKKKAYDKSYIRSPDALEHDRELNRQRARATRKNHPEIKRAHQSKRRAAKKGIAGSYTGAQVLALFKTQKGRCAYCKTKLKKYEEDHIMPLALKGSNRISNIQLLCVPCNQMKKAKHPVDFAREIGLLI